MLHDLPDVVIAIARSVAVSVFFVVVILEAPRNIETFQLIKRFNKNIWVGKIEIAEEECNSLISWFVLPTFLRVV